MKINHNLIQIGMDQEDIEWSYKAGLVRKGTVSDIAVVVYSGEDQEIYEWTGVLGELAYSKHTGHPVKVTLPKGGDDGTDFPGGVQVKASRRSHPPKLMIPVRDWRNPKKVCKSYVLSWVSEDRRTVKIMGAISRPRFHRIKGRRTWEEPTYYVEAHQLQPLEDVIPKEFLYASQPIAY